MPEEQEDEQPEKTLHQFEDEHGVLKRDNLPNSAAEIESMLCQVVKAKLEKYAQFFEDLDESKAESNNSSLYEQLYKQSEIEKVDVSKLKLTEYENRCAS